MGLSSWFWFPGTRLDWREEMRRGDLLLANARRMAAWRDAGYPGNPPLELTGDWRRPKRGTRGATRTATRPRRLNEQRRRQWWRRECRRFNTGRRRCPPFGPGERLVQGQDTVRPGPRLTPEQAVGEERAAVTPNELAEEVETLRLIVRDLARVVRDQAELLAEQAPDDAARELVAEAARRVVGRLPADETRPTWLR